MTHIIGLSLAVFTLYLLVAIAILADLWSGLRKAKKLNKIRTSYGLRRTIEKSAKYYNLMLVLTVIDAMQLVGIYYINTYYSYTVPMIPFMTFIGAIGVGIIEVKSIYEKAEDKELHNITKLASEVAKNHSSVEGMVKTLIKYLEDSKDE